MYRVDERFQFIAILYYIQTFSIADIGTSYASEYKATVDSCGDYSKYTNVNYYNYIDNIREQLLGNLTSCHSITTTTPGNVSYHTIFSLDFLSTNVNDVIFYSACVTFLQAVNWT